MLYPIQMVCFPLLFFPLSETVVHAPFEETVVHTLFLEAVHLPWQFYLSMEDR